MSHEILLCLAGKSKDKVCSGVYSTFIKIIDAIHCTLVVVVAVYELECAVKCGFNAYFNKQMWMA